MTILYLGGLLLLSLFCGAVLAYLTYSMFQHKYEKGIGFICGLLLVGLLVFEIIPESLETFSKISLLLGIIIGCFFYSLSSSKHSHNQKIHHSNSILPLMAALLLHTIPLSVTLGSLITHHPFPYAITSSIVIHHIPEGFALTTLFLLQHRKLISLLFSFFLLTLLFISFIWIGMSIFINLRIQGLLMGTSICLIGLTSIREFIFSAPK